MRRFFVALPFALVVLLTSCVSARVPLADANLDHDAKQFLAEDGKTVLYIYRPTTDTAWGYQIQIVVDGKVVGALAQATYFKLSVRPGSHLVTAIAPEKTEQLEINSTSGAIVFVEAKACFGWSQPRACAATVLPELGRTEVTKGRLAKTY